MSLDRAIRDFRRFITEGGFRIDLIFTSPVNFNDSDGNSINSVTIKGLEATNFNSVGTDGVPVNSKNCRITFIEADLKALNYPVRNQSGEVNLQRHRVSYVDKFGITRNMKIKEVLPDQTIGSITAWLGDV